MTSPISPPFLTSGNHGTAGCIKQRPEDFRVDEIATYEPSGEGDHIIARIRKNGISTFEAIKRLARALDVRDADIGSAGLKDARAITTQQLSLPPPTTPESVLAVEIEGIEVLSAARHPHKLRTGHLRGNKFRIVIRECNQDAEASAVIAQQVLDELTAMPGMPNWFGEQRFGMRGDNGERGRDLLLGRLRERVKPRMLRLYLSSIQSLLFNEYLMKRLQAGTYRKVIEGDILKKTDSGGLFETDDATDDQARMDRGEVVPTGPMFGPKMKRPSKDTVGFALEATTLEAHELAIEAFSRWAKLAPGTRRPLAVALGEVEVKPIDDRAIAVSFSLPSGSYATSVVREITKLSSSSPLASTPASPLASTLASPLASETAPPTSDGPQESS